MPAAPAAHYLRFNAPAARLEAHGRNNSAICLPAHLHRIQEDLPGWTRIDVLDLEPKRIAELLVDARCVRMIEQVLVAPEGVAPLADRLLAVGHTVPAQFDTAVGV